MSTIFTSDIYPGQTMAATPSPLETASAGGPAPDSFRLPMAAWLAFVILLFGVRLVWDYSE